MYVAAPRRHSARTFFLLLLFYAAVGVIGTIAAIVAGAGLVVAGVEVTPEHFVVAMIIMAPIGLTGALTLWHRYVRPRIKSDREQAFADFEALKKRYGVQ